MKVDELRKSSKDELAALLLEKSKEQFNLRMQKGSGQLEKPDQMKKVRRDIARIKTIMNELAGA